MKLIIRNEKTSGDASIFRGFFLEFRSSENSHFDYVLSNHGIFFYHAPTLFSIFVVFIVCNRKVSQVKIRDQEEAKDIVSDVFLKLCINRNRIHISQTTKGYLYQCVRNGCLNYLEHVKRIKQYALDESDTLEACDENDPLAAMISAEELHTIEQVIDSLPPKCREIFVLARFDRLSYQEIADKLKISLNTVKKQIAVAKDKLRETLEKN